MYSRAVGYRGIDTSVIADVRTGMFYVDGKWPTVEALHFQIDYLLAGHESDEYLLCGYILETHRFRSLDIQPTLLPDLVSHAMISLPTEEISHVDEGTDHQAARDERQVDWSRAARSPVEPDRRRTDCRDGQVSQR